MFIKNTKVGGIISSPYFLIWISPTNLWTKSLENLFILSPKKIMHIADIILSVGRVGATAMWLVIVWYAFAVMLRMRRWVTIRLVIGFFLIAAWAYLTILYGIFYSAIGEFRPQVVASLFLLFLVSTQLLIIGNRPLDFRFHVHIQVILDSGWIAAGMAIAQIAFPSIHVISTSFRGGVPILFLHPIVSLLIVPRGLLLFYLVVQNNILVLMDTRDGWTRFKVISMGIMGIGGFSLVFSQSLIPDAPIDIYTSIYIVSRFFILFAIALLFVELWNDERTVLPALRGVTNVFLGERIHFALYGFGDRGPELIFDSGFSFLREEDHRYIRLISVGLTSLTSLGRGDEYIEGSTILPVVEDKEYTGLALNGWIDDPTQNDPRFEGRTYISLLIVVERSHDWIFSDRKRWENSFFSFLKNTGTLQNLTIERCSQYVRDQIVESIIMAGTNA